MTAILCVFILVNVKFEKLTPDSILKCVFKFPEVLVSMVACILAQSQNVSSGVCSKSSYNLVGTSERRDSQVRCSQYIPSISGSDSVLNYLII